MPEVNEILVSIWYSYFNLSPHFFVWWYCLWLFGDDQWPSGQIRYRLSIPDTDVPWIEAPGTSDMHFEILHKAPDGVQPTMCVFFNLLFCFFWMYFIYNWKRTAIKSMLMVCFSSSLPRSFSSLHSFTHSLTSSHTLSSPQSGLHLWSAGKGRKTIHVDVG